MKTLKMPNCTQTSRIDERALNQPFRAILSMKLKHDLRSRLWPRVVETLVVKIQFKQQVWRKSAMSCRSNFEEI